MAGVIRTKDVAVVALTAGVEASWTVPAVAQRIRSFEVSMDVETDVRMAYRSGQTADGGDYDVINPDYWEYENISFPSGMVIYFFCAVNNTLRINYGWG